jgi:hypothetical protein
MRFAKGRRGRAVSRVGSRRMLSEVTTRTGFENLSDDRGH